MNYISLNLDDNLLDSITTNAREYALSNGIVMRTSEHPHYLVTHAPFCLFPSPFPAQHIAKARAIQKDINTLMHRVAHDYSFLKTSLKSSIENDEFTEKLFNIYEATRSNPNQPYSLGLLRTDYMIDEKTGRLGQIEINTIASSFAGLVTHLGDLHRYTLSQVNVKSSLVPRNNPVKELADGIVQAWKLYDSEGSVVLFMVEVVNRNFSDQRLLERSILELEPKIQVIFKTFGDMRRDGQLSDGNLFVGDHEVAVVYYRTGYVPELYEDGDWEARLMVEKSRAIKCPSIQYHLAGSKKIQQELCRPGVVERYLPDVSTAALVRETFVPQHSLDLNKEGDEAVQLAMKNPQDYVLKPQREGGGHNLYGEDVRRALLKWGQSEERQSYILMQRVHPPTWENYIVRPNVPVTLSSIVSELGVYGVVLGNEETILVNKEGGLLLRSKNLNMEEGGIAAGYGVLDTPWFG